MNDNKLFELCKEVYEKFPEWSNDEHVQSFAIAREKIYTPYIRVTAGESYAYREIPLYTSDYLLEKLPAFLSTYQYLMMEKNGEKYGFGYAEHGEMRMYDFYCDTPLKALLKLTLALHKAGELK